MAQMQGNSATAGALGGGGGEWAANIYMDEVHQARKSLICPNLIRIISAISTLTAGILGGLSTDSSTGLLIGAQAGKNAVENNALSFGSGMDSIGAAYASWNRTPWTTI